MGGLDIEMRVAAIVAEGEKTLVLHGPGQAGRTAVRMLPALPEVCFAESADLTEAVRYAVDRGLDQVILFATADEMASFHGVGANGLLSEITADMGGTPALAAEVGGATSAGQVCALWRDAGLLGQCGRELCRRLAGEMESTVDALIAAQVVLVDETGERMIGMYGRLRR